MKFKIQNKELDKLIGKFQEGGVTPGAAPAEETSTTPEQGGSPEEQLIMACQQALETQDCNLAMQVCQAIMQMMGSGAPEQAPQAPGEPVYRRGGKLVKFQKK